MPRTFISLTGNLYFLTTFTHPPPSAAKSLQSCPTLCDPIDSSSPGSPPWDSPGKNTGVGCHFLLQCMKVKSESEVAQLCLTLHDPMDCSLPGSSIHGIFQARVLEWGAIAFSPPPSSNHQSVLFIVEIIFLDSHISELTEYLSFSLFDLFRVALCPQDPSILLLQMAVCVCVCVWHFHYPFVYQWTFTLLQCLGYCK